MYFKDSSIPLTRENSSATPETSTSSSDESSDSSTGAAGRELEDAEEEAGAFPLAGTPPYL